jgi:hypothetical protein
VKVDALTAQFVGKCVSHVTRPDGQHLRIHFIDGTDLALDHISDVVNSAFVLRNHADADLPWRSVPNTRKRRRSA